MTCPRPRIKMNLNLWNEMDLGEELTLPFFSSRMSNSYEELVIFSLSSSLLKYLCSFLASVRATVVFSHSRGKCVVRASSIFVVDATTNTERLAGSLEPKLQGLENCCVIEKTSWWGWDQWADHVSGNWSIQSRRSVIPLLLLRLGLVTWLIARGKVGVWMAGSPRLWAALLSQHRG